MGAACRQSEVGADHGYHGAGDRGKQFIARRVPAAEWLVENVPSPDVIELMREYLPKLAARSNAADNTEAIVGRK